MIDYLQEARAHFQYSQAMRRDFHRHPELGFQEFRTAGIVATELKKLGMEVKTGLSGTGVMGILDGGQRGKTLLLRFDMDALPIEEQNQTDYISQQAGVMHACGHDGHMAIGLTAARILSAHREEIPGRVVFVFQPAEEGLGGAAKMIADGVLEAASADYCLGLHLWNEKPLGWAAIVPGPFMAGADLFRITLHGKGGHGALPEETVDPILTAAHVVTALQSIVARNISPLKTAVVSVTALRAGDAFNVIPQTAELRGTIRTFENEIRSEVHRRFSEIVNHISRGMGCEAEVELWKMTPALVNQPNITAIVKEIISTSGNVLIEDGLQTMASEDMAEFLMRLPGCFFMVGSANAEKGLNFSHHHPRFDFDEEALVMGAGWICSAAIGLLSKQPSP